MLPPFVPPSARVAGETLPLITEFVVNRVERSFGSSFGASGEAAGAAVATLPSIEEFVRREPEGSHRDHEFIQRTSRSPWGTYEAQHEVAAGSPGPAPMASAALAPAEAWAASAVVAHAEPAAAEPAAAEPATAEPATAAPEPVPTNPLAPSQVAPEVWVAEERDAFDWHAAANLAVPPVEEQRAAEEWSSTEWERSSGSVQDHVAAILAQLSRRVRSGELEVNGSRQMGPEAALVAALSALLAEPGRK